MKSVTKILSRIFPISDSIPKNVLESARQRGSSVHEWIEQYNNYLINGGEEPVISFEYQIYADIYKKWIKDYDVVPIHSELKLSNSDIVGVIDMICKTREGDMILVDFKITYDYNLPYVELQSSAYNELAKENKIVEDYIPQRLLHINKMGYNYIPLDNRIDMFNELVKLDKYLDERSKKK